MLPPGAIIGWLGNKDNIPAGFERYTPADGRFIRGATAQLGLGGGSLNHNHTYSHSHPISDHTHSVSVSSVRNPGGWSSGRPNGDNATDHSHSAQSGSVSGGGSSTTSVTFQNASALPAYFSLIFIRATKWATIPVNGLIFRVNSRGGLTLHSASQNRFLRGADSNSNPDGAQGGGTHQHTDSGHTHNASGHTHGTVTVNANHGNGEDGTGGNHEHVGWHTHEAYATLASTTAGSLDSYSGQTSVAAADSIIPPWVGVGHYYATKAQPCSEADIILYSATALPIGWIVCDGSNGTPNLVQQKLIRHSSGSGGNASHTHTYTHTHSGSASHTHSLSGETYTSYTYGTNRRNDATQGWNNNVDHVANGHRHQLTGVSSATCSYGENSGTTSAATNNPPYVNLKFLYATKKALGGSGPIMAML